MSASSSPALASHRLNNFNALRLLLATLVLVTHATEIPTGLRRYEPMTMIWGPGTQALGDLAVNSFFLVSGFLITQSWLSRPHAGRFLLRRVARIYPGFLVAALICGLLLAPWVLGWSVYFQKLPLAHFLLGLPVLQFHGPKVILPAGPAWPFNSPLYTIPYEFLCYLAVLAFGLMGLVRKRVVLILWIVCVLTYASLLSGIWMDFWVRVCSVQPLGLRIPFMLRFGAFFLTGALVNLWVPNSYFTRRNAWLASLVFLVAMVDKSMFMWFSPMFLLPFMLFGFAFGQIPALKWFQSGPDLSYGTYLYGWPIQLLVVMNFPQLSIPVQLVMAGVLAYAAGLVSWTCIESPILKWTADWERRCWGGKKGADAELIPAEGHPQLAPGSQPVMAPEGMLGTSAEAPECAS